MIGIAGGEGPVFGARVERQFPGRQTGIPLPRDGKTAEVWRCAGVMSVPRVTFRGEGPACQQVLLGFRVGRHAVLSVRRERATMQAVGQLVACRREFVSADAAKRV
jgi:hypothetical protein